jgi:tetratricopeptide (TPR) repeat protein
MMKRILLLAASAALFVFILIQFLSFVHFNRYKNLRSVQGNLEKNFPALEECLVKSIRYSRNPIFYYELGQIYLQRAYAENDLGQAEARDRDLDKASEAFRRGIARNPIDAYAFNALGYAYQLYNYPLFTYMVKGRANMQKALELYPKDEFLTSNIAYVFLRQWEFLSETEKKFIFTQLKRNWEFPEYVFRVLKWRWRDDFGNYERLNQILSQDSELWLRISQYFK